MPKLRGVVKDFEGNILKGADVRLQDKNFNVIYETKTDENGHYELNVESGVYPSLFICKDYSIKYLEYWGWQVPIFDDMVIDARIGGLELYAMNAFSIQIVGIPTLSIYFRPMSLKRSKEMEIIETEILSQKSKIINISPELDYDDIKVTVNGTKANVLEINKVLEYGGKKEGIIQHIYGYLIQVDLENIKEKTYYNRIDIVLYDKKTGEYGEGTVFTPSR